MNRWVATIALITSSAVAFDGGACLTYGTPKSRVVPFESSRYVRVAVSVEVSSACPTDSALVIFLQAIDKDGFELAETGVEGVAPRNQRTVFSNSTLVEKSVYPQIVRWKVKSVSVH